MSQRATRGRPRSRIAFEPPIMGPSGHRLLAYTWAFKRIEVVDRRGEERTLRVSDWDSAEVSGDTGRDLVHKFEVACPLGHVTVMSAESAIKALGFAARPHAAGAASAISAAKTLGRLVLEEARAAQEHARLSTLFAEVSALPLPEIPTHTASDGWVHLGEGEGRVKVRQIPAGPLTEERRRCLIERWQERQAQLRVRDGGAEPWRASRAAINDRKRELVDLAAQIQKATEKLAAASTEVAAGLVAGSAAWRPAASVSQSPSL